LIVTTSPHLVQPGAVVQSGGRLVLVLREGLSPEEAAPFLAGLLDHVGERSASTARAPAQLDPGGAAVLAPTHGVNDDLGERRHHGSAPVELGRLPRRPDVT
jgi:hypothetical protein